MSGAGASGARGGSYGSLAGFDKGDLDNLLLAPVDFDNLPMFRKNFYEEHPDVAARTEAQIREFREARALTSFEQPNLLFPSSPRL